MDIPLYSPRSRLWLDQESGLWILQWLEDKEWEYVRHLSFIEQEFVECVFRVCEVEYTV